MNIENTSKAERLGDLHLLSERFTILRDESESLVEKLFFDGVLAIIDCHPTIDVETLSTVKDLKNRLEQAEKEIEILKGVASPNCIACDRMHQNGNCLAVGGFCTSVPAAYCPLIPQMKKKLAQYEQTEGEYTQQEQSENNQIEKE